MARYKAHRTITVSANSTFLRLSRSGLYVLFESTDQEPDREVHILFTPEVMASIIERYQALQTEEK